MSEHRRKPPQSQGGGRAAARRGAQQPPGRRAAPQRDTTGSAADPYGEDRSYGGRAQARRAAQRGGGGRRRAGDSAAMAAGGAGHGGRRGGGGGYDAGGYDGGGRGRGRRASGPAKKRLIDYPRYDRYGWRRWVPSWKQVLGSCVAFAGLLVGAAGLALAYVEVPDVNKTAEVQKNVYYWADGSRMVVAGGGELNRQIVPITKIPKSIQNAVIAAENASFEEDSGVDPMGIARAVLNMARGGSTQSGSTITQQYVKNAMLSQEQTVKRKVTELFISIKVGATVEKDNILAGYLNTAYYGRGSYGIQAAAQAYFGKDCDNLTPGESAVLAAVLKGPNFYDPAGGEGPGATQAENHQRAEERQQWILDREVEVGRMTAAERAKYTEFPKVQKPRPALDKAGQKGYMIDLADNYIVANSDITKAQLDLGGYEIHTTFDKGRVAALEKAVKKVTKENIDPKKRDVDNYVQFGGASVEPGTGKIVAIYGGEDATKHYNNNADYTGVQVGSTFKPFVLTAAMRDGVRNPKLGPEQGPGERTLVSPKSIYNGDNKLTLRNYDGTVWQDKDGSQWRQRNDGDESRGRIDLRTAMQFSVNTPFIQLGMDVGTDKVRDAAVDAGLNKDQLAALSPTFSLGTSAPSAIRLAGAYATFAASGEQVDPYSVSKVEREGQERFVYDGAKKQAFESAVADNVTDVLRTVVEKGTGTSAQIGRPAAGKTGTTDDNKSAWFAGFTPQLATSIGMFRVDDRAAQQKFLPMYGVGGKETIHGASFPAEIWADYMKQALANEPVKDFPVPQPIGEKVNGYGASPSPSPSPSQSPTQQPSETPSTGPSRAPTKRPKPSDSCDPSDWACLTTGGTSDGGTTGETITSSPTATDTSGNGNGNGNGSLFGGPTG